jgi:transposase
MDTKDRVINQLREENVLLRAENTALRAENVSLREQIEVMNARLLDLEIKLAKATKNSSNSSKSPSSDMFKPPKPTEKGKPGRKKKRKQGAQPGHAKNVRELLPPERVDETVVHEMSSEEIEQLGLTPLDEFEIIQQFELIESPFYVVEHKLRKYQTADSSVITPFVPDVQGKPIFGTRLITMIGFLKSKAHCSYSTIAEILNDAWNIPVSRGYLAKLCNGVISSSLESSHDEIRNEIAKQPIAGTDESGIKENGLKNWIWCVTCAFFTFFQIQPTRGRKVLEETFGDEYGGFSGVILCDYFSANQSYCWNFNVKVQYCWAHLIRDICFYAEKYPDKKVNRWAAKLMARSKKIIKAWHRRNDMSESGRRRSYDGHRQKFLDLMLRPPKTEDAIALVDRFRIIELVDGTTYDMSDDYFRFISDDGLAIGVPPTNNQSEQAIRFCVIDRKITQGTRSAKGNRYHERMWTSIATCQKQGRSFFEFLHASIDAHLSGGHGPSLLPPK